MSVGPGGEQGDSESHDPSVSADGRFVAFESGSTNLVTGDTNSVYDVFLFDREAASATRVSVGAGGTESNGESWGASVSGDGGSVAFVSMATNLAAGGADDYADVFVHDGGARTTRQVSIPAGGGEADGDSRSPRISAFGSVVVFDSTATTWWRTMSTPPPTYSPSTSTRLPSNWCRSA